MAMFGVTNDSGLDEIQRYEVGRYVTYRYNYYLGEI